MAFDIQNGAPGPIGLIFIIVGIGAALLVLRFFLSVMNAAHDDVVEDDVETPKDL
jgi:hypothetical protein